MRSAALATLLLASSSGCGLILDTVLEQPVTRDGGVRDSRTTDVPDAARDAPTVDVVVATDTATPDASRACAMDLDAIGMSELPLEVDTDCGSWFVQPSGMPVAAEITSATDGSPYAVLLLGAPLGGAAALVVQFERTAYDLDFAFDWLSFNATRGIDERMSITVDGVVTTPDLRMASGTSLLGEEIHSTAPRGSGWIHVPMVDELVITLRNPGPGDGLGIELHSFTWLDRSP